ncbi:sepiapterin reductase-like [Athalia rosae]|uniref:sepiapterin reductase-like n=1 Tax=Athalia rosae TaxID=37344 RepID=UPI0020348F5A|nr:sepiapterin reductase-like [Athalia rosae]
MPVSYLSGKVYLLITGASQGIGKQIAESFGALLGDGSVVLLLARNEANLQATAKNIPSRVKVITKSVDLAKANAEQLKAIVKSSLGAGGTAQFEKAILVHNAGIVGDNTKLTTQMTDYKTWREYYDLNLFAPAILNGVFMDLFKNDTKVQKLVINLTSDAAINAVPKTGYYCTGKAARAMFFRVFALEYPDVNVMNYSPGPVDTELLQRAFASFPELKAEIEKTYPILTTEQTVNRLIERLNAQNYKSGDHVDYFDKV